MRHWKKGLALAILAATCGCSDNRGTSGTGISDREAASKGDTGTGPESRDTGSATGAGGGSASAPAGTTGEASPSPR